MYTYKNNKKIPTEFNKGTHLNSFPVCTPTCKHLYSA